MGAVLAEWGMAGVEALRARVSVLVVVDVLSFSTAVDIAVSRGAAVLPFPYGDRAAAQDAANRAGAVLAQPRRAGGGQLSLSPASLLRIAPGTRLVLPSPHGARLSLACGGTPVVAGCLRNAAAVARAALGLAGGGAVGVIPAGERWPDGSLRPAIEDWLGAGAVIHHLAAPCSAEAELACGAFRAAGNGVARLVRSSVSGCELANRGFSGDVDLSVQQDVSRCVPLLAGNAFRAA